MSRLIGSAASLQQLADLINQRWTWISVRFNEQPDGTWQVYSNNILQPDLIIKFNNKRYRLELI